MIFAARLAIGSLHRHVYHGADCLCNRLWVLKNSLSEIAPEKRRARKPYKRFSSPRYTFLVTRFEPDFGERDFFNTQVHYHSLPEWHRDKALGQLVDMGVIHPSGGANAVAGWWLCYRDEFAPVGTTSTIDAKSDITLLLIIARSALSPDRNKQLNPHVGSESGFIRLQLRVA